MHRLALRVWIAFVPVFQLACSTEEPASGLWAQAASSRILPASTTAPVKRVRVVKRLPHDRTAYTQGLYFKDGLLYEGTGLTGASDLRVVDPTTGRVLKRTPLASDVFGEGVTVKDGLVYQLTWQNGAAYVYDETASGFARRQSFAMSGEGWGLTHDDRHLIRSDGSDKLYFVDPVTFRVVRTITVKDGTWRQRYLNELEYVDGAIYANVWQTSYVVKIDPASGKILTWYDAGELRRQNASANSDDVLNGIAFNPATKTFFLAGKRWANLYEVSLP